MGNPNPVGNPKGRPKGSLNKTTSVTKAALALFVEGRVKRVMKLWDELAESEQKADKARAIELWTKVAEYVYPKLARQELTGTDGEKLSVSISINGIRRERDHKELGSPLDTGGIPRV